MSNSGTGLNVSQEQEMAIGSAAARAIQYGGQGELGAAVFHVLIELHEQNKRYEEALKNEAGLGLRQATALNQCGPSAVHMRPRF